MRRSIPTDVTYYQEVVGEAFLPDNAELKIDSFLQLGCNDRISPPGSLEGQFPQLIEGAGCVGHPGRNGAMADRDIVGAALRNFSRGMDRLRTIGKMPHQFVGG